MFKPFNSYSLYGNQTSLSLHHHLHSKSVYLSTAQFRSEPAEIRISSSHTRKFSEESFIVGLKERRPCLIDRKNYKYLSHLQDSVRLFYLSSRKLGREFALTNGTVSNEITKKMSNSMMQLVLYKSWLIKM